MEEDKSLRASFGATFNFAWHYWSEHRYAILFLLILIALQTFLEVLIPVLGGKLYNSFSDPTRTWITPGWIGAYLCGANLTSHICRLWAFSLWSKTTTQVLKKILTEAFEKIQYLSTEWHINNFSGSIVTNINRGKSGFDSFSDMLYLSIYPNILTGIALITILFWNSFLLGITSIIGFTIFFYTTNRFSKNYLAPAYEEVNQIDTHMNGILSDAITCNSLVKAFAAEENESQKFSEIADEWSIKNKIALWRMETSFFIQNVLFWVTGSVILGISIWLWFEGIRTTGDVITILISYQMAQSKMAELSRSIRLLIKSINDMKEIVDLDNIDIDAKIAETPASVSLEVKLGEISFNQVDFSYNNQAKLLYENFSVTIAGGEKIALVGRSGSGKSTFTKLIQRLYDVQKGEISIDGQNIHNVTKQSLRRNIAIVSQDPILFHRSIAENIGYAKPEATRSEIEQAARKAYAHDFIINLPDGYDTKVGTLGIKLSGGERQRVAIARAILADRPILILDEATSSLDSVSEALIQKALNTLITGRTTIIIAHRLSTIKEVDRILVFAQGQIAEQGTHNALLANLDSHYYALYSLQSDGFLQEPSNTEIPLGAH
jgi:ATP-binding cassette subfamily B protein